LTCGDPNRILPVSGYDIGNGNAFSTADRKEYCPRPVPQPLGDLRSCAAGDPLRAPAMADPLAVIASRQSAQTVRQSGPFDTGPSLDHYPQESYAP
jgi:hypothetical protein